MPDTVSIKIKKLLVEHSMSIKDLCAKIGMTENGYHQMIRNDTIKLNTLYKIAKVFSLSSLYFMDSDDESRMTIGKVPPTNAKELMETLFDRINEDNEAIKSYKVVISVKDELIFHLNEDIARLKKEVGE